jgi:phosphatidylinositol-3-phosphatase
MKSPRRLLWAVCLAAGVSVALLGGKSSAASQSGYSHVVWIVMENHSYSQIIGNTTAAPYINSLAQTYGSATDMHAESHPSLPNYIAMTSGSTQGITDDYGPRMHPLNVPNLFTQLGTDARALEESMPSNCYQTSSGAYAVRHDPAVYYTNFPVCPTNVVPLGSTPDLSAKFTFITPNLCHDMHDCSIATGDAWLQSFVPKLLASPEYTAETTVIFITWDEDNSCSGCTNHIPTIVISPTTKAITSSDAFNHYSMLRTTEEILGLPLIAGATNAASMGPAFNLDSQTSGPTASFTYGCTDLTCSFDGSGSSGGVTAYSWDFGDGVTGSGATTSHTFAASGTYPVTLTVTGQAGTTDSLTKQVTVSPPQQQIAFVASADANGNGATESLTVPASVSSGDGMVLIATGAGTGAITAPAGWQPVGSESSNGSMVTSIWSRVATSSDAGTSETLTFGTTYRKGAVELLAYSGTSTSAPVAAFATHGDHVTTTTATTPPISVATPGSWVVSGWEVKSSTVTAWVTTPAGQVVRDAALGSGSGRIDMLAIDSGAAVPVGTAGGLSATTDQAFTADNTLTLVLAP